MLGINVRHKCQQNMSAMSGIYVSKISETFMSVRYASIYVRQESQADMSAIYISHKIIQISQATMSAIH